MQTDPSKLWALEQLIDAAGQHVVWESSPVATVPPTAAAKLRAQPCPNKLRYFVGLNVEESAAARGIVVPTAKQWWAYALAWLTVEMRGRCRAEFSILYPLTNFCPAEHAWPKSGRIPVGLG